MKIPYELFEQGSDEFNLCLFENNSGLVVIRLYHLKPGGDPGWQGDSIIIFTHQTKNMGIVQSFKECLSNNDFILWERLNSYSDRNIYEWWVHKNFESPEMSVNEHDELVAKWQREGIR